jgi:uncharacterized repeat protein (TIGR01451 family)
VVCLSLTLVNPVHARSLTGKLFPVEDGDTPDPSDDIEDCAIAVSLTSVRGTVAIPHDNISVKAIPKITKVSQPLLALPGDEVQFTITVANTGKQPISNIVITDHVPASFMVQAAYPERDQTIVGNSVIFYVDDMPPGKIMTLTINTRVRTDAMTSTRINNEAWLIADGITRRISSTVVEVAGRIKLPEKTMRGVRNVLLDDLGWLWLAIIPALLVGLTLYRGWQRRHPH